MEDLGYCFVRDENMIRRMSRDNLVLYWRFWRFYLARNSRFHGHELDWPSSSRINDFILACAEIDFIPEAVLKKINIIIGAFPCFAQKLTLVFPHREKICLMINLFPIIFLLLKGNVCIIKFLALLFLNIFAVFWMYHT